MAKTNDRITVEALKFYIPLFQMGELAEQLIIEHNDSLTPAELNSLQTKMKLKELTVLKLADLSAPLITRELNKIIATSHIKNQEGLFDMLYTAGLDGMRRGLRKFEVDKIKVSSTNYLFQWITTYAKKELNVLEAPFGIPASRFQKYKKISAVRKKLSNGGERPITNEEIYAYFQSGEADVSNMNGRVANRGKPSKANLAITLEVIEEQERFEKEMLTVELLDPLDDYMGDVQMSETDGPPFSETLFGVFVDSYNVTEDAKAVIMSELNTRYLSDEAIELLQAMPSKTYNVLFNAWKNLLRDAEGPFYDIVKENLGEGFEQFDMKALLSMIEKQDKPVKGSSYTKLFVNEKASKK